MLSTFDYSIDISDQLIVQVENKGHAVDNNDKKTILSKSKSNIITKKENIAKSPHYSHSADIRYGTITAYDRRDNGIIKCWLLDPPPFPLKGDLRKKKINEPVKFYLKLDFSSLSKNSSCHFFSSKNERFTKIKKPIRIR